MAEIKTQVIKLNEGETYTAKADDYLITEKHTIADILRFCAQQAGGAEDVQYILSDIVDV